MPNLPATRAKAEAYSNSKSAAVGKASAKKMVVAGVVTKSSRAVSRHASDFGSSNSSFTSGSTSRSSTARDKLPEIAAAKGVIDGSSSKASQSGGQSLKSISKARSGAGSVQQQQEVMRSSLQQTKAVASQEQARIKNAIQQQLQPGKMLF